MMKCHWTILFLLPYVLTAQVDKVLNEWKKDKDLANASIGFSVADAKTASVISEYQSQLALVPASTLKILSTYAAMSKLGPHYKFETRFFYVGTLDSLSGVLDGDLLVLGGSDPTLQSEHFAKDNLLVTDKWAKQIRDKGIKEIKGKIIADASCLERTVPDEWIWGDIGNYYGAVPCGLSFNENKFNIVFSTKELDSEAEVISLIPSYQTKTLTVNSQVYARGTEDKSVVYGDPFSYTKEIRGFIPPNKKRFEVAAALPDPALLCVETLCKSLNAFGVKCNVQQASSRYTYIENGENRVFLFSHFSPALENIVHFTNLNSINLFSETLLRQLGKGDFKKGLEEVYLYWQSRGLDLSGLNMKDGSGLARSNTITTALMSKILSKIYNDTENYKIFLASLPVAGRSGSLNNIGKGRFIENNMHAKTGYMERVRAYAGYVKAKSGKDLVFSVIINNYNCSASEMKSKIENFLTALEAY